MAGREGTVYGTGGSDLIWSDYVDPSGVTIWMFDDDDLPGSLPDRVIVAAGDGDDALHFESYESHWDSLWNDQLVILAGTGNDEITFYGALFSWRPGAPLIIDAGDGDDMITAWWPGLNAPPQLTGGAGADIFRVASFDEIGALTISDYTIGEDSLMLMSNGEAWHEITPEILNLPPAEYFGQYRAFDTADGLRIDGYHSIPHWDGTNETWTYEQVYSITLAGVTLADFMAGGARGNVIDGTEARDIIWADYVDADGDGFTQYADTVMGGAGHDNIKLDGTGDVVMAGDGRDFVIARGEGHRVHGEGGDDYLIARQGGSELDGGTGNDRLVADIRQGGDHVLTGGEGADSFEFLFGLTRHAAQTEITDFELGVDRLSVDGAQIDLSALPAGMLAGTDSDGSVILSVGLNDTVTLRGVTEADLGLVLI